MVQCHNQEMFLLKQLISTDLNQQTQSLNDRLKKRKSKGNPLAHSEQITPGYFK